MQLTTSETNEKIAVIIATRGRPTIVAALVQGLFQQTRPPDHVFVIGSGTEDIVDLTSTSRSLTTTIGRVGLTRQRNDGMALLEAKFSHVIFLDDDFVPSTFWIERMVSVFRDHPEIVGLTGTILADGIHSAGIGLEDAIAIVQQQDAAEPGHRPLQKRFPYGNNVGSNMAYRFSAMTGLRFDERLPLYGWHEDSDFRSQIERRGSFVKTGDLWGVHLGHKVGRVRGNMLGYSQVANVIYLAGKGMLPKSFLLESAIRNVLSNAVRSLHPEPFIDRRGRLRGNMLALRDLLLRRLSPERVTSLR